MSHVCLSDMSSPEKIALRDDKFFLANCGQIHLNFLVVLLV